MSVESGKQGRSSEREAENILNYHLHNKDAWRVGAYRGDETGMHFNGFLGRFNEEERQVVLPALLRAFEDTELLQETEQRTVLCEGSEESRQAAIYHGLNMVTEAYSRVVAPYDLVEAMTEFQLSNKKTPLETLVFLKTTRAHGDSYYIPANFEAPGAFTTPPERVTKAMLFEVIRVLKDPVFPPVADGK